MKSGEALTVLPDSTVHRNGARWGNVMNAGREGYRMGPQLTSPDDEQVVSEESSRSQDRAVEEDEELALDDIIEAYSRS